MNEEQIIVSTYLVQILNNTCVDMLRKRKPRNDAVDAERLPVASSHELGHCLTEAVESLPAATEVEGTAKTEFGKIVTDFPVFIRDTGGFEGRAVIFSTREGGVQNEPETFTFANIKFGTRKGGVWLKLETSADITIKKE